MKRLSNPHGTSEQHSFFMFLWYSWLMPNSVAFRKPWHPDSTHDKGGRQPRLDFWHLMISLSGFTCGFRAIWAVLPCASAMSTPKLGFLHRLCLSRRQVIVAASAAEAEERSSPSESAPELGEPPSKFRKRKKEDLGKELMDERSSREKKGERRERQEADSENLARQFVEAGDINAETVLKVLRATDIPLNTTRKNVLPDGVDAVRGMLLGFYALAGNIGITDASKSRPWLVQLLSSFARKSHPAFEFTSIQVNKNYASRPHVDKNNLGESLIIGLGDYTDGDIWVHDPEGVVPFELREDISCMYHYEAGVTYNGSWLDIHNKWIHFNGNRLHFTQPFTGDRFTLVYYTCSRYMDASSELSSVLRAAGFPFCKSSEKLAEASISKLAEKNLEHEKWKKQIRDRIRSEKEQLGRCQARTWNKGWGGSCPHFKHGSGDFCKGHSNGSWKTHGTIDGPVPKLKQAEMLKFQKQMVAAGERPPDPLPPGAMILVECGNSWNSMKFISVMISWPAA